MKDYLLFLDVLYNLYVTPKIKILKKKKRTHTNYPFFLTIPVVPFLSTSSII